MHYCNRCLYPENHPLGLSFDDEGVCSGCQVHEEKDEIEWAEKEEEFGQILDRYRNRPKSHYDCVIPVTGSGDSFFIVDTIKNKWKLNPLLVTYNVQSNTKIGVRNLARLCTELDCDHMQYTVSPDKIKKITQITMHELGDMYWHYLAGSQTFPVQIATRLNIPLIIWGVHGWLDQVGMFSHHDSVEMTRKVRKEHGLRGFDADSLLNIDSDITSKDLQAFTYPSDAQLEKSRVRGLYLGNFIRWDAQKQIEQMIEKYGYETTQQERTFNKYETTFCWNNAGVHDYIKYLKFGYGKATDHACRDIRLNRLSREEGLALIKNYDHIKPEKSLKLFLEWSGMSELAFHNYVDQFRDPKAWEKYGDKTWEKTSSEDINANKEKIEASRLDVNDARQYIQTPEKEPANEEDQYVLMGRSYIDDHNFKAVKG
ncbi:MAG: N-acetyl sugar amidotransferase [Oligoflexales bacterium]